MQHSNKSKILVDFHTIFDPVKLAHALLLYIPQYGKICIPEHYKNIYVTGDLNRSGDTRMWDVTTLNDFDKWKHDVKNFNQEKDILQRDNIAASIELLRLSFQKNLIEFVPIPSLENTESTLQKIKSKGLDKPYFLENLLVNWPFTGLGTISPQHADVGFLLSVTLCEIDDYRLSIGNPEIKKHYNDIVSCLGVKPKYKSDPISEVLTQKAFPEKTSGVLSLLDNLPLFQDIANQVSLFEKEKSSINTLKWFFPKLVIGAATGRLSAVAEFSYHVFTYLKYKQKIRHNNALNKDAQKTRAC